MSDDEHRDNEHDDNDDRRDDDRKDQPPERRFTAAVLVQSIENFSNGDTRKLNNFLQAIDHAAKVGEWSNKQRFQIAVMWLKNEALECYNTSAGINTWKDLKELLQIRFGCTEPRSVLRRKLNASQQRPGEDPMTFSQRLKTLMLQIDPGLQKADEKIRKLVLENLMDRFIDGLRPSLCRTLLSKQPDNWASAIEIAQFEYQLEELDKVKSARLDVLQEGESAHHPEVTVERPAGSEYYPDDDDPSYNNNSGPRSWSSQSNRPHGAESWINKSDKSDWEVVCCNCGVKNHIQHNCSYPTAGNRGPSPNNGISDMPTTRCPVCAEVQWHQVSCPAATPVTQASPYNPPAQREA